MASGRHPATSREPEGRNRLRPGAFLIRAFRDPTVGVAPKEPPAKEEAMCANCGCGIPEDKHGDERNINWSEVVASAEASDISPQQAAENIMEMARQQGS